MKHFTRFFLIVASFFIVTPLFAAYGGEPATFAGSTTGAPHCSNSAPKMVWPFWARAAGANAIDLSWGEMADTSSWTVAYGVASRTYIYGVSNFGNASSRSLRIGSLPNGTYYVTIRANNGCMPGPFANEWRVTVGGGAAAYTGLISPPVLPIGNTTTTTTTTTMTGKGIIPTLRPTVKLTPKITVPPVVTPGMPVSLWQKIINFFSGK